MTRVLAQAEEEVVWQVCPYLRRNEPYWDDGDGCKHCPRWEVMGPTEEGGLMHRLAVLLDDDENAEPPEEAVQRGCFALAHEVVMICRTGNPWGRVA